MEKKKQGYSRALRYVADNLNITRHIVREYGKYAMGEDEG